MPTEDVIQGQCGCGCCIYRSDHWSYRHDAYDDAFGYGFPEPNHCPWCRWEFGEDGFARRMVDVTVEDLRARIASLRTGENLQQYLPSAFGRADELELLLSEEADSEDN